MFIIFSCGLPSLCLLFPLSYFHYHLLFSSFPCLLSLLFLAFLPFFGFFMSRPVLFSFSISTTIFNPDFITSLRHIPLKFPKTFRPYGVVSRFSMAISRNISGFFSCQFPGHFWCQIVSHLFSLLKIRTYYLWHWNTPLYPLGHSNT